MTSWNELNPDSGDAGLHRWFEDIIFCQIQITYIVTDQTSIIEKKIQYMIGKWKISHNLVGVFTFLSSSILYFLRVNFMQRSTIFQ